MSSVACVSVSALVAASVVFAPGVHARRCRGGNVDVRAGASQYVRRRGVHAQLPKPGRADVRAADFLPGRSLALGSTESSATSSSVVPFGAIDAIPSLTIGRAAYRFRGSQRDNY